MDKQAQPSWYAEFAPEDLAAVRRAIPEALHNVQERSARAQTEFADPDGDQDVYGVGMSRGAPKELQLLLEGLPSFREVPVPGTRRSLIYVGDVLLFLLRVGKRMPRNHHRIRPAYLPEGRRSLFAQTGDSKYQQKGLFEMPPVAEDEVATLLDALAATGKAARKDTLFVPYYSSTPSGIGAIYWGPARLSGRHLEFAHPEQLTYVEVPAVMVAGTARAPVRGGFADGERPRTTARLRRQPEPRENK